MALAFHLGAVPTAFISGERNFLTVPFVLGFGIPLSPSRFITFTPWYELAISANVDTVIRPEGVTIDTTDPSQVQYDPKTMKTSIKASAVESALAKGVTVDVGVSVPMRVGLEAALHAGKSVDFNFYGMFSTLGGAFSGDSVKTVGVSLLVRWDDIVPAVLPKAEVDDHESCATTERHFRACPNSRFWLSPEQRGQAPASTPAPAGTTTPAPSVAPVPVPRPAPAPAPAAAPAPVAPAPAAPPATTTPASSSFPPP
jgi:hypothetical protein